MIAPKYPQRPRSNEKQARQNRQHSQFLRATKRQNELTAGEQKRYRRQLPSGEPPQCPSGGAHQQQMDGQINSDRRLQRKPEQPEHRIIQIVVSDRRIAVQLVDMWSLPSIRGNAEAGGVQPHVGGLLEAHRVRRDAHGVSCHQPSHPGGLQEQRRQQQPRPLPRSNGCASHGVPFERGQRATIPMAATSKSTPQLTRSLMANIKGSSRIALRRAQIQARLIQYNNKGQASHNMRG